MLKYKRYVMTLFLLLIGLFGGSFVYVYYFAKTYPIPLTHRISMDDKFRFMRDMDDRDQVDTIIVGSSLGLNNVQGSFIEETSAKTNRVLNISAYGIKTTQVEEHLEVISLFPNVKRVIYLTQFPDFSNPFKFQSYDVEFNKRYVTLGKNAIDPIYAFHAYKNIIEFAKNHWQWEEKFKGDMFNFGLAFDHTGSVPLYIYGDDINEEKFYNPHPLNQHQENFDALSRMAGKLDQNGIDFYLFVGPYRQPILDKYEDLRMTMENFIDKANKIVTQNGGFFFNLHQELKLDDSYFVDRFHVNDKGSELTGRAIGKFIDKTESANN